MPSCGKTGYLVSALAVAFLAGFVLQPVVSPLLWPPAGKVILSRQAPDPVGPYSQAVQSGDLLFISGQIGLDPATGNLSPTVDGQTVQVMENLRAILQESGLDFSDVIQTRIYLVDLQDFTAVNGIYEHYFRDKYPARATVQVAGLPRGAAVEIEMVAGVR